MLNFGRAWIGQDLKQITVLPIPREQLTLKQMKQFALPVKSLEDKYDAVREVFESLNIGQSIIFLNVCSSIEIVIFFYFSNNRISNQQKDYIYHYNQRNLVVSLFHCLLEKWHHRIERM